jgi:hypothetical protein
MEFRETIFSIFDYISLFILAISNKIQLGLDIY